MGNTPKWERGAHLEISTDEKLDYLYSRDDAQQEQIDELIEGGGGGGSVDFDVNTINDPTQGLWTCNKTYAEIKSAYAAGSRVIFNIPYTFDEEDIRTQTLQMTGYQEGGEGGYIVFAAGSDPDDLSTARIYGFYAATTSDYPEFAV